MRVHAADTRFECALDYDAQSFLPPGGTVRTVSVYPSNFGMERMKLEQQAGPHAFLDDAGLIFLLPPGT